jgi:hypothetical protein
LRVLSFLPGGHPLQPRHLAGQQLFGRLTSIVVENIYFFFCEKELMGVEYIWELFVFYYLSRTRPDGNHQPEKIVKHSM